MQFLYEIWPIPICLVSIRLKYEMWSKINNYGLWSLIWPFVDYYNIQPNIFLNLLKFKTNIILDLSQYGPLNDSINIQSAKNHFTYYSGFSARLTAPIMQIIVYLKIHYISINKCHASKCAMPMLIFVKKSNHVNFCLKVWLA